MGFVMGVFARDRQKSAGGDWRRRFASQVEAPGLERCAYASEDFVLSAGAPASLIPYRPGHVFVAAGRIKNRTELTRELGTPPFSGDHGLMLAAYQRWGADCCARIIGDWLFAAWDDARRELILARDHLGNTALYYQCTPSLFAFSTSRRALIDLNLVPSQLDEMVLAQLLVCAPLDSGRTIHSAIDHVPPARLIRVTPQHFEIRRYWAVGEVSELRCKDRQDYVEGFRNVFDLAVRESLPETGKLASQLSGGLDSGSVTATAAHMLRAHGGRLAAYTSVPIADPAPYTGARFGNELPFASAVAEAYGNIDHHTIDAAGLTPLAAIREALQLHLQPLHAAGNYFWMTALLHQARRDGAETLLTGQSGNAGISWTGSMLSQPLGVQLKQLGVKGWFWEHAKHHTPQRWITARRLNSNPDWAHTAISAHFAERIGLRARWLEDRRNTPYPPPLQLRLRIFGDGERPSGLLHAESGAAAGLHVTDPTADPRVMAYCLSIPDAIFFDPESGYDRWVIRAAMAGRLPDKVRLNRRRGLQAADMVVRLRASAEEVEAALADCAAGPAADYIDIARLRRAWARIKGEDSTGAFSVSFTTLTRGLMAGLFVNGFGKSW